MTKQQYLTASKLFMELADLFKEAGETLVEESHVIAPLVEKPIEEVKDEEVIEPVNTEDITEEMPDNVISLDMTIQQLRAKAKELGLSTKGTKKDLVARITESLDTEDEVEDEIIEAEIVEDEEIIEDEDVEEEIEDEDVEIEDEEDEVEEDEELSQMEVIQAELEAMSLEELQEVLESVDLPTKGKKQALISRILDAVEEGILEFEAEEEFEYDAETDYEEDEDEEFDAEIEEELEDDLEDIEIDEEDEDEEELSPREQTQLEVQQEIEEAYESGDLTDKEIAKFLEEYFNGRFKPINKKRAFNKYLEIQCDLVDADGERMPMKEAYYVNEDEIFCCGADINQLDNGNLYCEVCGTEYEME